MCTDIMHKYMYLYIINKYIFLQIILMHFHTPNYKDKYKIYLFFHLGIHFLHWEAHSSIEEII